jgi:hypothetical protein
MRRTSPVAVALLDALARPGAYPATFELSARSIRFA